MNTTQDAHAVLSGDGTPLKQRLAKALRRQKMRALLLISPLLLFVMLTFIVPIVSMLFRSVEDQIVSNTLPETVVALQSWDAGQSAQPDEAVYQALFFDLFNASEAKRHSPLGSRLNYQTTGMSSLFRSSGRNMDDIGKLWQKPIEKIAPALKDGENWYAMMTSGAGSDDLTEARRKMWEALTDGPMRGKLPFTVSDRMIELLPLTSKAYADWAVYVTLEDKRDIQKRDPWEVAYAALGLDLADPGVRAKIASYDSPGAADLQLVANNVQDLPQVSFKDEFIKLNDGWAKSENWTTIKVYTPDYTSGYFLNAIDKDKGEGGIVDRPENEQIYIKLFGRTLQMSLIITFSCILLGYPVAWLLANLPARSANLLMILVLLPFWTSLLVRTSAWKVLLQQQGVINELLVWLGFVSDSNRLELMHNQTGTIIAMTHILLPFMILPLYSVMKTIPIYYTRAAKSLGATNWTTFWRVYFPQSVPGIGAGSILVFILAIGYYITPEIVGGTDGVFISNRIAYHISRSLNWGLAAALGTILLVLVLALYWAYDRIVGIDNVKLGG